MQVRWSMRGTPCFPQTGADADGQQLVMMWCLRICCGKTGIHRGGTALVLGKEKYPCLIFLSHYLDGETAVFSIPTARKRAEGVVMNIPEADIFVQATSPRLDSKCTDRVSLSIRKPWKNGKKLQKQGAYGKDGEQLLQLQHYTGATFPDSHVF